MLGRRWVGARIRLIPRLPDHLRTIYAWYDCADFLKGGQVVTYDRFCSWQDGQAKQEDAVIWSIARNANSDPPQNRDLIGIASLFQCRKGQSCRNGYVFIHPAHRRRGYATEAVQLCADYAFTVRDVDVIQAPVDIDDEAIHRVLERAGYTLAGRGTYFYHEQELYLLHRDSWTAAKQSLAPASEAPQ